MTKPHSGPDAAAGLRKIAEDNALAAEAGQHEAPSPEESRQTLHELRVHQIELETQNEELRRAQAELEVVQARYFDLYDLAPVGYCTVSAKGLTLEANLTAATLLGVARGALIERPITRFIFPGDEDIYYRHRRQLLDTGTPQTFELRMLRAGAAPFWAQFFATDAENAGGAPVCRVVMIDITDRKRAEEVQVFLAQTSSGSADEPFFNALARYLATSLGMDFVCIDRLEGDGLTARTVAVWSDGKFDDNVSYALKDTPCGDVVGKTICCFAAGVRQMFPHDQVLQDLRAESYAGVTLFGRTGRSIGLIAVIGRRPLENSRLVEATLKLVAPRVAGELEWLEVEAEKARLEAQLRQAQKMESVGRLAGGVAHDFNNMLGVILGHAELALEQVDASHPLHADLEEIQKAASRSADLTRQLLAFARKQTIAPKVLDLNATVAGMLKMLERLIGEDIRLAWRPGADLWPVRMDPSQVDQILANLCVNARDAIGDAGAITIETDNRVVDAAYCAARSGLLPGDYVRIAVGDDGCGMNQETLARIFEPFFTTKEMGRGTGLGLATVYGAVKQNSGFIDTSSDAGRGTTVTIYLPRHVGKAGEGRAEGGVGPAVRGKETILLVEDEPAILKVATVMLERQGYTVIAARSPGEAIHLAREHPGEIHLLMTDVVMPEMHGRDLARNLLPLYPRVGRLFMSGYTADVIADHGVLAEGVHFIQKPFSMKELVAKVRAALDWQEGGPASPSSGP